jgi:hypothetical protein
MDLFLCVLGTLEPPICLTHSATSNGASALTRVRSSTLRTCGCGQESSRTGGILKFNVADLRLALSAGALVPWGGEAGTEARSAHPDQIEGLGRGYEEPPTHHNWQGRDAARGSGMAEPPHPDPDPGSYILHTHNQLSFEL